MVGHRAILLKKRGIVRLKTDPGEEDEAAQGVGRVV